MSRSLAVLTRHALVRKGNLAVTFVATCISSQSMVKDKRTARPFQTTRCNQKVLAL